MKIHFQHTDKDGDKGRAITFLTKRSSFLMLGVTNTPRLSFAANKVAECGNVGPFFWAMVRFSA